MWKVSFILNGESRSVEVDPEMPLLWFLRDVLGLTGTKYSCGIAECGACTVLLDGEEIRSCVTPVSDIEGNWGDYEPLRMGEEPEVVTRVLESDKSIGGIGEPGVPPVAPALVNAIAAVTGEYATLLPLGN